MIPFAARRTRRAERGVVLFIALVVLIAMSLGGIALMRSVTGGLLASDNMRLQRAATISGDLGVERGRDLASAGITNDDAARGLWSSWSYPTFDPATYDWTASTTVGTDTAGNTVRVVVHRMCQLANQPLTAAGQQCLYVASGGGGSSKLEGAYGQLPLSGSSIPYYRVTVRIDGPKNAVSYVQAMLGP